jgi:hypothetical protein
MIKHSHISLYSFHLVIFTYIWSFHISVSHITFHFIDHFSNRCDHHTLSTLFISHFVGQYFHSMFSCKVFKGKIFVSCSQMVPDKTANFLLLEHLSINKTNTHRYLSFSKRKIAHFSSKTITQYQGRIFPTVCYKRFSLQKNITQTVSRLRGI